MIVDKGLSWGKLWQKNIVQKWVFDASCSEIAKYFILREVSLFQTAANMFKRLSKLFSPFLSKLMLNPETSG